MPAHSFIRIFEEHYTCFRLLFAESIADPSEEVIHQMRVEIKYLVALIHFVKELAPVTNEDNLTMQFKRIAKKSGKVRDWQVIQILLEAHPQINKQELVAEIDSRIANKQQKYMEFAQTVSLKKQIAHELPIEQIQFSPALFNGYVGQLQCRAKTLLEKGMENREYWHKARHLMKRGFYLMTLANRLFANCFPIKEIQEARQLEQLIGNWHDQTIIIDFCDLQQIPVSEQDLKQFDYLEKEIINKISTGM